MDSQKIVSDSNPNEKIKNEYAIKKIQEKLEQLRSETSSKINKELDEMMREIMRDIEKKNIIAGQIDHLFNYSEHSEEIRDKVKTKDGALPEKQFIAQNSLLTDLFEVKHIRSIYHIFLAILFGMFVNIVFQDLLINGEINLGFQLILTSFSNFPTLLTVWTSMFSTTAAIYLGLHLWATIRIQMSPKSLQLKIWDNLNLVAVIIYFPWFIYFFTKTTTSYKITIPESIAALCELTRLVMKAYSFIRSNVPRVLKYKLRSEDQNQVHYPEFHKYLYFLFAPTLIYQDNYPRTSHIRWNYVVKCFIEVFGSVLFLSFLFQRFFIPTFQDFGLKKFTWQELTMMILSSGVLGILVKLTTFYAGLHAWMNGFAEMLRFGDRMFYKDWWTSTSYGRYYRTWNVVVHDWLYKFIYKDMCEIVTKNNKTVAKFTVFLVSALFHEFILGFAFKFCFPMLFMQFFGVGLAVSSIRSKNNALGNTAMWYGLGLGMGILSSTFSIEYYARINCPIENYTFSDYFIPRSIHCYSVTQ